MKKPKKKINSIPHSQKQCISFLLLFDPSPRLTAPFRPKFIQRCSPRLMSASLFKAHHCPYFLTAPFRPKFIQRCSPRLMSASLFKAHHCPYFLFLNIWLVITPLGKCHYLFSARVLSPIFKVPFSVESAGLKS